jgi:hypothetical protein
MTCAGAARGLAVPSVWRTEEHLPDQGGHSRGLCTEPEVRMLLYDAELTSFQLALERLRECLVMNTICCARLHACKLQSCATDILLMVLQVWSWLQLNDRGPKVRWLLIAARLLLFMCERMADRVCCMRLQQSLKRIWLGIRRSLLIFGSLGLFFVLFLLGYLL